MGIRTNAEYRIIEAIRIDTENEVVLGQTETRFGTQYVTWKCKNGTDYYWGHYITDYDSARIDLFKRVLESLGA